MQRVGVIGAGMIGLATAHFLAERGVDVTVVDRTGVAAGSSWGNAGWLTPALTAPRPEPAVLSYGLRAMTSPTAPVFIPIKWAPTLYRVLIGFARHCTAAKWEAGLKALVPLNQRSLAAFEALDATLDADLRTRAAEPFLAGFRTEADRQVLLEEIEHLTAGGQDVPHALLDGDEFAAALPLASDEVTCGVRLDGQRYIDPGVYMETLAAQVRAAGMTIDAPRQVASVSDAGGGARIAYTDGTSASFDAVVIATGAELPALARPFGVKAVVQAGRGYSFSVPVDRLPDGPVYFPTQRVACTPLRNGRLRLGGMMEFRNVAAPRDPRRITTMADAAAGLLRVDTSDRQDEWVGARPCTIDGLPLIGATGSPRVFVGGGHGMWGIMLGPLTGQLLAELITEGTTPVDLTAFSPLR